MANVKEFFNKKKDNKEEGKYEEVKDPQIIDNYDNNVEDNANPSATGTVQPILEKKEEKKPPGNFFSRGFNSMVTSTKSVNFKRCIGIMKFSTGCFKN